MVKHTLKRKPSTKQEFISAQELIFAIEQTPLDELRKQNLIAAIKEKEGPFHPTTVGQLIILLDYDNAIQRQQKEMKNGWSHLARLYNEKIKPLAKNANDDILIEYIVQLARYNQQPTVSYQKRGSFN